MSENEKNISQEVENEETKEEKQNNAKSEYDELNDRYKRLLAEFENYKKRSQKERESL